jgi:hypothetical protein
MIKSWGLILFVIPLVIGCSDSELPPSTAALQTTVSPASPSPKIKPLRSPESQPDSFAEAINMAQDAANLAQEAKSEMAWNDVVSKWQKIILLLKAVPKTHPKYAQAQKKVKEYQKNLNYAQTMVKSYTKRENTALKASQEKLVDRIAKKYGHRPHIVILNSKKSLAISATAWNKLSEAEMSLITSYAESQGAKAIIAGKRAVWNN